MKGKGKERVGLLKMRWERCMWRGNCQLGNSGNCILFFLFSCDMLLFMFPRREREREREKMKFIERCSLPFY